MNISNKKEIYDWILYTVEGGKLNKDENTGLNIFMEWKCFLSPHQITLTKKSILKMQESK